MKTETVRDVEHVWVRRESLGDGSYQYVKRWKKRGMPWAEYWPVREHSLLVRLREGEIRHVVEVIGIDLRLNEVRTRDAGISLDRLDRRVQVKGEPAPHPHPFFDIAELLKLIRWALVALEEIHGVGVVHCDLSAGNICVPLAQTGDGWSYLDYSRLTLIDFAFSLHRALPLKHPLPLDTTNPELFYLPPFFRAAIARDQREGRPVHGQRGMTAGIDLYSLGMITQGWYRAGVRPHDRISAASVETLFHHLANHGSDGTWREMFRASAMQLIHRIDGILARANTDIGRSPDLRLLEAGVRPVLGKTAITPLFTRIRPQAEETRPELERGRKRVRSPTTLLAPLVGNPLHRLADNVSSVALGSGPTVSASGNADDAVQVQGGDSAPAPRFGSAPEQRAGRGRTIAALLLLSSAIGAALYWDSLSPSAPPAHEARVATTASPLIAAAQVGDGERLTNALASRDGRVRAESAQSVARLAREGGAGIAFADRIARRYLEMLNASALQPDAPELHARAWAALSSLAAQPDDLPFAATARKAIADYEARTEELHRRLGGLIYDRQAQAMQADWNEYVLRLDTLAMGSTAGAPRAALILGLVESANGSVADAFRHMLVAVLGADTAREASGEVSRLLQRLIDTGDRKALMAILHDVEQMAGRRIPGWQIWAARINDVLNDESKATSWYAQVIENKDAGSAELDFAQAEIARLLSRR